MTHLEPEISKRFEWAIELGRQACFLTNKAFLSQDFQVDLKADQTFVTECDRSTERFLRERILDQFPHDGLVGEEYGNHSGSSGYNWYLDPIDGTQAFVRNVPLFGTLLGIERNQESVVGVIGLGALHEMVYAAKDHGCFWERGMKLRESQFEKGQVVKARVSKTQDLKQALLCTTWLQSFLSSQSMGILSECAESVGVIRGWGDCYGYALVATGRSEIMIDPVLSPWDGAPMPIILKEAQGMCTDLLGKDNLPLPNAVATNGFLHEDTLHLLRKGMKLKT